MINGDELKAIPESGFRRPIPERTPSPGGRAGTCDECGASCYHEGYEIVCASCGLVQCGDTHKDFKTKPKKPNEIYRIDPRIYHMGQERFHAGETTNGEILGKKKNKEIKTWETNKNITQKRKSEEQADKPQKRKYKEMRKVDWVYAKMKRSNSLILPKFKRDKDGKPIITPRELTFLNILNTNRYIIKDIYEKTFYEGEYGKIDNDLFTRVLEKTEEFCNKKTKTVCPAHFTNDDEVKKTEMSLSDSLQQSMHYHKGALVPKRRDGKIVMKDGEIELVWSELFIHDVDGRDFSAPDLKHSVTR